MRPDPRGVYENVLAPTDGSVNTARGIAHATDLAAETGARLHVLFVVDETVYGADTGLSSYEAYLDDLRGAHSLGVAALTSVERVGPKTAERLYEELGVATLGDLLAFFG